MNPITLSIQYAGMTLQVVKNDAGEDVTPLKPFADMLGLKWESQRKKVTESPFYSRYLGVCTPLSGGADGQKREQTCILVSRVAAYLMSISPDKVRSSGGNEEGAQFLEEKLTEWADALHALETYGVAFKSRRKEARSELHALFKTRTLTENPRERAAVSRLIAEAFVELGQPLEAEAQQDLPGV